MTFKKCIFEILKKIPSGKVITYKDLAAAAGKPKAARAVGRILNSNPSPVQIPCHRVICSNGRIGGYKFGSKRKIELLKKEGVKVKHGFVDLKKYKILPPKFK